MKDKYPNQREWEQINQQINASRRMEIDELVADRNRIQYKNHLGGYEGTIDYVNTLHMQRWLDIGSGTTLGIHQISTDSITEGFEFEATVLYRHPDIQDYLGFQRTHISPVERLSGIPDRAFSLVTALNSVAYSVAPKMAVREIDRVLIPGGVFQGTFLDPEIAPDEDQLYTMNPPYGFEEEFRKIRYDCVVEKNPDSTTENYILIAVKNGGRGIAKKLLDENLRRLLINPL